MTGVPQDESPSSSLSLGLCVQGTGTSRLETALPVPPPSLLSWVPQTHPEPTENQGPLSVLGLLFFFFF